MPIYGDSECLILTVEQAAVKLGISRGLAYDAARRGVIPVLRIGRRVLIPAVALEKLLEQSQSESSVGT